LGYSKKTLLQAHREQEGWSCSIVCGVFEGGGVRDIPDRMKTWQMPLLGAEV
jgi:hypothetical protein